MPTFTTKQGEYLAFIYWYTRVHRSAPAEADIRCYFRVTAPTVHGMIKKLHSEGFIERVPGQARSITVLVPSEELPIDW